MMTDINSEQYKKIIGENVKFWRNIRGLKQSFIAKKIGVKQSYISQLETGKFAPSLDYLHKIANLLDVEIEDIIAPQPHRDLVLEVFEDKSIDPPVTDDELKDLLALRFRSKEPNLNFFYFMLELLRGGKTFFRRKSNQGRDEK